MATKSKIKIVKHPGKVVRKKQKATSKQEEVNKKIGAIKTQYEAVEKKFSNMLNKTSDKHGKLPSDDGWYKPLTEAKTKAKNRATYMTNRQNDLNTLFHKDMGDEATYFQNRIAELQAQVDKLKAQSTEDKKD